MQYASSEEALIGPEREVWKRLEQQGCRFYAPKRAEGEVLTSGYEKEEQASRDNTGARTVR